MSLNQPLTIRSLQDPQNNRQNAFQLADTSEKIHPYKASIMRLANAMAACEYVDFLMEKSCLQWGAKKIAQQK